MEELPLKHNQKEEKWSSIKLSQGNWFSSCQYFKVITITDKESCQVIKPENPKNELTMSLDILEHEMNCGKLYEKTEKLSRTEIVELMINARECAFTVVFHKQIDGAHVKEVLADACKDNLKELSKSLAHGKEVEMTCFLTSSEGTLGRSRVIDLSA